MATAFMIDYIRKNLLVYFLYFYEQFYKRQFFHTKPNFVISFCNLFIELYLKMLHKIFLTLIFALSFSVDCQENSNNLPNNIPTQQIHRKLRHGRKPLYYHSINSQTNKILNQIKNKSPDQQSSTQKGQTQSLHQEESSLSQTQKDFTKKITGSWTILNDPATTVTFEEAVNRKGKFVLSGCNINSCEYTLHGNHFSTNSQCLSTQRGCLIDNDPIYLDSFKKAVYVFRLGKDKIVFYDNQNVQVLVLIRKKIN